MWETDKFFAVVDKENVVLTLEMFVPISPNSDFSMLSLISYFGMRICKMSICVSVPIYLQMSLILMHAKMYS